MILTSKTLPKTITHPIPPTIVSLSRRFAIINGTWFEVDESVTLDMLQSRYVRRASPVKQVTELEYKTHKVKSSTGKGEYTIREYNNGLWSCTCPAYGFKRKCKHIEQVKSKKH